MTATIEPVAGTGPAPAPKRRTGTRGRAIVTRLGATPRFWVGAIALAAIALWAIFGLLGYPWSYDSQDPLQMSVGPSASHWFGTDDIGGDIYAQTVTGLRKSLLIGLSVGPLAALLAGLIGASAGYFGGRTDKVIIWFTDLMLVFPAFYLLLLVSPMFKRSSWIVLAVFLILTGWMVMARIIRGQTKSLAGREFVQASRYMGVRPRTIIRRHILPNVASLLIIDATLGVGAAILSETTLSYFGFGIQPPDTSLGTLLATGTESATTRPWLFFFPAGVLVATVLATSLVGDALRDAIDPTSGVNRA